MFWKKPKILITHNGSFHSDDVFAAAALFLYFQKMGQRYKLVRSTDSQVIEKGDIVFDIGGVYNENTNRFDHHQKGGAGERKNGIPYASFGLVWKHFGQGLVESDFAFDAIDRLVVQPIDAADNGMNLCVNAKEDVSPLLAQDIFSSFNTSFQETHISIDERFDQAVSIAMLYLSRAIHQTKAQEFVNQKVSKAHEEQRGSIVTIDDFFGRVPISIAVSSLPEVLYFVYPSDRGAGWSVCTARVSMTSFESKKPFPESWRGLRDGDLEKISGVSGAVFCHNSGFLCAAKTKEGALELAKKALSA